MVGLRDRALLSVLVYSFARVSAAVGCGARTRQATRGWLRLHERGGERHDVLAHHRAEEALEEYVAVAGLEAARAPRFQSVDRSGRLSGRPPVRRAILAMIKRRATGGGASGVDVLPHVSGDGDHGVPVERGTLEHAQRIAGHASPKTTKLYDRTAGAITRDEIERIVI